MKLNTVQLLLSTLTFSQQVYQSTAFAPNSGTSSFLAPIPSTIGSTSTSTSSLAVLPGGGSEFYDLHHSFTHILSTSSHLLSDASTTAIEEASDPGLWDQYLNIFKAALELVHSTIDQPLKNAGWDQTWGISIFLFTAGVRTLLLPLSIQQTKSSEYIKVLKPYQDEIKKKFKDNQDMINRATAKLFEDANTNPLAGCLVSILQLPILLGLYRGVTLLAKDGQLAEPFLWIPSLEGPVQPPEYRDIDWLTTGWVNNTPQLGWETTLLYLIMPLVLVLGQSITMRVLTPPPDENASAEEKEQAESTQRVLKFLPLLIGFFSLQVPAGLTIYWFTSNLYTLSQSLAIRAYYKANPPEIELPDYWDSLDNVENMSPEEKRKAAAAGMSVGPKWEDVLDEARYHYLIQRTALREGSDAWERVKENDIGIPKEMMEWVNNELEELNNAASAASASAESSPKKVEKPKAVKA